MNTKVSTKGQVVLPGPIRRKLGLQPGDTLEAVVRAGNITLIPRKGRRRGAQILSDPVSGLPVLSAGPDAPLLTSKQVHEILEESP
jgi:AbrB family looped-hinge helix DNA binding protein